MLKVLGTRIGSEASPRSLERPVAADAVLVERGIVCRDENGNIDSTGVAAIGLASFGVDNTGGADGAKRVVIEAGVFELENSEGADEITEADVEAICYLVDYRTVALTDGNGTRPPAGRVTGLTDEGDVRVQVGPTVEPGFFVRSLRIQHTDLDAAATSQVLNLGGILPANARLIGRDITIATPFSGGGAGAVTLDVGGTDPDSIIDGADLFTGATTPTAGTAGVLGGAGHAASLGGQQLTATIAADVNVALLTAGDAVIRLFFIPLS